MHTYGDTEKLIKRVIEKTYFFQSAQTYNSCMHSTFLRAKHTICIGAYYCIGTYTYYCLGAFIYYCIDAYMLGRATIPSVLWCAYRTPPSTKVAITSKNLMMLSQGSSKLIIVWMFFFYKTKNNRKNTKWKKSKPHRTQVGGVHWQTKKKTLE